MKLLGTVLVIFAVPLCAVRAEEAIAQNLRLAQAQPQRPDSLPAGSCMPIGLTARGEIVFPWECRELIEKQRGPVSEEIPNPSKDSVSKEPVAQEPIAQEPVAQEPVAQQPAASASTEPERVVARPDLSSARPKVTATDDQPPERHPPPKRLVRRQQQNQKRPADTAPPRATFFTGSLFSGAVNADAIK
jgi:hypothetical protein